MAAIGSAPARRHDRAATVGVIGGLLGVVAGNVTLAWPVACVLGLGALLGGALAAVRARRRGTAPGRRAIWAMVLGLIAVGLGIAGAILLEDFFSSTDPGDAFVLTPG